jgi:hypothetical protein
MSWFSAIGKPIWNGIKSAMSIGKRIVNPIQSMLGKTVQHVDKYRKHGFFQGVEKLADKVGLKDKLNEAVDWGRSNLTDIRGTVGDFQRGLNKAYRDIDRYGRNKLGLPRIEREPSEAAVNRNPDPSPVPDY